MKHVELFDNNLKINKMNYQIINGKKFPLFPFYATGKRAGCIYRVVDVIGEGKFLAMIGSESGYLSISDAIPVSISEINLNEQPAEKKYRPWTREDIRSLLFFKDKIFRHKNSSHQTTAMSFIDDIYSEECVLLFFQVKTWFSFVELFHEIEYSTDGTNWLPCGVEI